MAGYKMNAFDDKKILRRFFCTTFVFTAALSG